MAPRIGGDLLESRFEIAKESLSGFGTEQIPAVLERRRDAAARDVGGQCELVVGCSQVDRLGLEAGTPTGEPSRRSRRVLVKDAQQVSWPQIGGLGDAMQRELLVLVGLEHGAPQS